MSNSPSWWLGVHAARGGEFASVGPTRWGLFRSVALVVC